MNNKELNSNKGSKLNKKEPSYQNNNNKNESNGSLFKINNNKTKKLNKANKNDNNIINSSHSSNSDKHDKDRDVIYSDEFNKNNKITVINANNANKTIINNLSIVKSKRLDPIYNNTESTTINHNKEANDNNDDIENFLNNT